MTTSLKETPAGSDGLHVDGVSRHSHIQLCVGGIRVYKYDNILAGVYRFAMYTLPNAWLCRASKMLRLIPSDLDFESGSPLDEHECSLSLSGRLGPLHLRPVFPPTAVCVFTHSSNKYISKESSFYPGLQVCQHTCGGIQLLSCTPFLKEYRA